MFDRTYPVDAIREQSLVRSFFAGVYAWMFLGLLLTAFVSVAVHSIIIPGTSLSIGRIIATNSILFWALFLGELILVFALVGLINKIPSFIAAGLFLLYSAVNGMTLSTIFLIYSLPAIGFTFLITAGMFGIMSFFGFVTKMDLSRFGSIFFMALIGLILASIVNIFLASSFMYWMITYAGVLIFIGLTAYDTQKLKRIALGFEDAEQETSKKASIIGALALYLDFINLFLFLLRIFGGRRR
ncbi:MAG: Bax inhibitor-1/YccA family protein [Candidatus Coatesbacteria bacterium]|nr:Bax inhibitor-1/YccA family protein [Candidatus Coatesbacteria bacterium]